MFLTEFFSKRHNVNRVGALLYMQSHLRSRYWKHCSYCINYQRMRHPWWQTENEMVFHVSGIASVARSWGVSDELWPALHDRPPCEQSNGWRRAGDLSQPCCQGRDQGTGGEKGKLAYLCVCVCVCVCVCCTPVKRSQNLLPPTVYFLLWPLHCSLDQAQ